MIWMPHGILHLAIFRTIIFFSFFYLLTTVSTRFHFLFFPSNQDNQKHSLMNKKHFPEIQMTFHNACIADSFFTGFESFFGCFLNRIWNEISFLFKFDVSNFTILLHCTQMMYQHFFQISQIPSHFCHHLFWDSTHSSLIL